MRLPSFAERIEGTIRHYEKTVKHYRDGHGQNPERGLDLGVRMARKHLAAFVGTTPEFAHDTKQKAKFALCSASDPSVVVEELKRLGAPAQQSVAA